MKHNKTWTNTILVLCLLFCGCDGIYCDSCFDLIYKNNADYPISVYSILIPPHEELTPIVYPDTSLPVMCNPTYIVDIAPHDNEWYSCEGDLIPSIYRSYHADTISIFFFSTDTLYLHGWDSVQKSYNILQRYDISVEEYKYLTEKIPGLDFMCFPPSPEMKDIKMWPPYGTYDSLGHRRQ